MSRTQAAALPPAPAPCRPHTLTTNAHRRPPVSEIRTSIAPRRPSIFAANALYLAAAAGLVLMPMAIDPLAALLRFLFPALKTEELLLASTLVYYLPLLVAPCLIYAGRRQLWDGLRLTEPLSPAAAIRYSGAWKLSPAGRIFRSSATAPTWRIRRRSAPRRCSRPPAARAAAPP